MNYETMISYLVNYFSVLGYIGIFILMFLESSFIPFPSELIMIPAGYLAYTGEINIILAIIIGVIGSLAGSWFNYFLAEKFGRKLILKFLDKKKLEVIEKFFKNHGDISTFNGRLVPLLRQYISFPAGLAKMNPIKFTTYTVLGAGLWVTILTLIGYFIGQNNLLIKKYLLEATILAIIIVFVSTISYIYFKKKFFKN